MDAALALRPRLQGRLHRIERVTIAMGRLQAAMLRSSRPVTGLDAKFSAEYALACALLNGRLGLAELTDAAVNAPEVQALLRRVQVEPLATQDPEEPLFSPADLLRVHLDDGTLLDAEPVHRALGHATRPIDDAALKAKFLDCGCTEAVWSALMCQDEALVA